MGLVFVLEATSCTLNTCCVDSFFICEFFFFLKELAYISSDRSVVTRRTFFEKKCQKNEFKLIKKAHAQRSRQLHSHSFMDETIVSLPRQTLFP